MEKETLEKMGRMLALLSRTGEMTGVSHFFSGFEERVRKYPRKEFPSFYIVIKRKLRDSGDKKLEDYLVKRAKEILGESDFEDFPETLSDRDSVDMYLFYWDELMVFSRSMESLGRNVGFRR